MIEFLFSNATGLSTAKDIFSDSFLKLSGEIISGAIEFSADWLYMPAFEHADIFFRYILKSFAARLSFIRNIYSTFRQIIKFYWNNYFKGRNMCNTNFREFPKLWSILRKKLSLESFNFMVLTFTISYKLCTQHIIGKKLNLKFTSYPGHYPYPPSHLKIMLPAF